MSNSKHFSKIFRRTSGTSFSDLAGKSIPSQGYQSIDSPRLPRSHGVLETKANSVCYRAFFDRGTLHLRLLSITRSRGGRSRHSPWPPLPVSSARGARLGSSPRTRRASGGARAAGVGGPHPAAGAPPASQWPGLSWMNAACEAVEHTTPLTRQRWQVVDRWRRNRSGQRRSPAGRAATARQVDF